MKHLPIFAAGALMLGLIPASAQSQDEMKRQQPEAGVSGGQMGGAAGQAPAQSGGAIQGGQSLEAPAEGGQAQQQGQPGGGEGQRMQRADEGAPAEQGETNRRAEGQDGEQDSGNRQAEQSEQDGDQADRARSAEEGTQNQSGDREAADSGSNSDEVTGSTRRSGGETRVELQPEQKTIIKETIVKESVDPIDVDFSISVGTVVPDTVVLYDLPPAIIEVVPAYRTYKYVLVDSGTILVIHPDTLEIVDVIYV